MSNPKLYTTAQFCEKHPFNTVGGIRSQIFNASSDNGFDKVVKRVGRKVLIDEDAYFLWIEQQNS